MGIGMYISMQGLDGVALGATFAAAGYSMRKYFWFALAFVLVRPQQLNMPHTLNPRQSSDGTFCGIACQLHNYHTSR